MQTAELEQQDSQTWSLTLTEQVKHYTPNYDRRMHLLENHQETHQTVKDNHKDLNVG